MKLRLNARQLCLTTAIASTLAMGSSAYAQSSASGEPVTIPITPGDFNRMRALIEEQTRRLDDQERRLGEQEKVIERLRHELDARRPDSASADGNGTQTQERIPSGPPTQDPTARGDEQLESVRAAGLPAKSAPLPSAAPPRETVAQNSPPSPAPAGEALPNRPVGEAPQSAEIAPDLNALPEGARVLTLAGRFVAESSVEYDRTSSNRLVFRGVEIVPGLQLGLIDANQVARDTVIGTADFRYGLADRLEIEARIPFVYRHDRLTVLSQQITPTVPAATQTTTLEGSHIGDIEFAGRYQLNRGNNGNAIFVGGLRVKSTTGIGPYDVRFDSDGIAHSLGTGSGFWAVEPSITMLYPSDPVVIYVTLGYLHNFGRNIDRTIGTTHVGEVDPGDAIDLSAGFGFALNPQFSISLGFTNTFIFATRSELGATVQHSDSLEAGAMTMGWSYAFGPNFTFSTNFEFGVTSDAPDMRVILRLPYRF